MLVNRSLLGILSGYYSHLLMNSNLSKVIYDLSGSVWNAWKRINE